MSSDLIFGLLAILLPFASTYIVSAIKSGLTFVDDLAPVLQQVIAFIVGFAISKLAALIGSTLPGDLHIWDASTVLAVLNGLATLGAHAVRKQK